METAPKKRICNSKYEYKQSARSKNSYRPDTPKRQPKKISLSPKKDPPPDRNVALPLKYEIRTIVSFISFTIGRGGTYVRRYSYP